MIAHSEGDLMHTVYKNIEAANHLAYDLLSAQVYNGKKRKVNLKKWVVEAPKTVTVPNSKEMYLVLNRLG